MKTNIMIERIAQAMCRDWDHVHETHRDTLRLYARAAIEAMREPTVEMEEVLGDLGPISSRMVWQAMIDEALHED